MLLYALLLCPGAALVTKSTPDGWHVEDTRFHGPNVLSCVTVSGPQRMPLIGAYLPTSSLAFLPLLESALQLHATSDSVTVLADLNADIYDLTKPRNQLVATTLANYGLLDLLHHFRQRPRFRHRQTWFQMRQGTLHRSRCDCILCTDRQLFESVQLKEPRNYSSDHLML